MKDYYAQLHAYKFDNLDELDQFHEDIICGFSAVLHVSVMPSVCQLLMGISSGFSFPSFGLRKFCYFFSSVIASILFSLLLFWNFLSVSCWSSCTTLVCVQSQSRSVSVNILPSSLLTSRLISKTTLFSAYETDRC